MPLKKSVGSLILSSATSQPSVWQDTFNPASYTTSIFNYALCAFFLIVTFTIIKIKKKMKSFIFGWFFSPSPSDTRTKILVTTYSYIQYISVALFLGPKQKNMGGKRLYACVCVYILW
jgi:hypothetical protein